MDADPKAISAMEIEWRFSFVDMVGWKGFFLVGLVMVMRFSLADTER